MNKDDELYLNVHNLTKIRELIANGAKPNKFILNSYLDSCSNYNNNCKIDNIKMLINNGAEVNLDVIINATLKLSKNKEQYEYIMDNYKNRTKKDDSLILSTACFTDDEIKYDLVRTLVDNYKIKPTEELLSRCIRYNNNMNNTKLKDKETEFNRYFYEQYRLNRKD